MAKNGLYLVTPTSIAYTGTSASIGANGSVTFSDVTSLSLNNVFSADYDNYLVIMRYTGTGSLNGRYRLRASGTDDTTASSYTSQYLSSSSTAETGARATSTEGYISPTHNAQVTGMAMTLYGPYLAQPTATRAIDASDLNSARLYDTATTHNQSVSYDGLTVFPASYTITGRITVYGMRK